MTMTKAYQQIQIKRIVERQETMKTSNASCVHNQYASASRLTAPSSMPSHDTSTSSSVCTEHTTLSRVTAVTASTSTSLKSSTRRKHIQQVLKNIAQNDPNTKKVSLKGYSLAREENMIKLVVSLTENAHVKTLYLHECGIDDIGASLLAFALRKNTSIRQLWLNKNNIGDVGADAIAFALSQNRTLKILGLNDNKITNSGGKAINNALKKNRAITEVFLRGNLISERAANKIYGYCERNYCDKRVKKSSSSTTSSSDSSSKSSILHTIQEHIPVMRKTAAKRNSIVAKCA